MGVRGVNLGNWLVLEKWMGTSPLSRASAPDDRGYIDEVPAARRERDMRAHYQDYVTEETFEWLAGVGIELVRIPVPYWLFGTRHHAPCVAYLDRAFDWAEELGMGILIDLHTVPMSQNGFDNGGYYGLAAWHRDQARIEATLDLLERIARRYAGRAALWGIEPLNEPLNARTYVANLRAWIRDVPARARLSRPIPRRVLKAFYRRFYERVRPVVGPDVNLVFHDHFALGAWRRWSPVPHGVPDPHVWIDTHQYVAFADLPWSRCDLASYVRRTTRMGRRVARAQRHHPVLVGEWSLANHDPHLAAASDEERQAWYRAFSAAQTAAWERGAGNCFWSLRVKARNRENWSFEDCVRNGWLRDGREAVPSPEVA